MWIINVDIEANEVFRASEILADLRVVSETLFYPMKVVGFWDYHLDGTHLCPQKTLKMTCPHELPKDDQNYIEYSVTATREFGAILKVKFPHAKLELYLK